MLSKEVKEQIEKEVKTWAKNNMCASCYSDMEVFVNTMNDLIDGQDDPEILMNTCMDELEFIGIEINNDVWDEVYNILKNEAKYWLKDYYKHKKDYEPEEIEYDF